MTAPRPQRDQATALIELVVPHYPVRTDAGFVDESWPLSGPALLARQTGTVGAIVQLLPIDSLADEIILERSLFDHATTFAWLAASDGPDRHRRFGRSDSFERLRMDDDCRTVGDPVLTPESRTWHEANLDGLEKNMPNLMTRAEQVDEDWGGQLVLTDYEILPSYRSLYARMYRHHSGIEHPSSLGLNTVAEDLPDGTTLVSLDQPTGDASEALMALVNLLYARSLCIASRTLGWPNEDSVLEVVAD